MKIYIAYELRGRDFSHVRIRLEKISEIIEELGHKTFVFIRDKQNWKPGNLKPSQIIKSAIEEMKKCDGIIAISESGTISEGLLIECGYMKALGKKIILANIIKSKYFLLEAITDHIINFTNIEQLREELKKYYK